MVINLLDSEQNWWDVGREIRRSKSKCVQQRQRCATHLSCLLNYSMWPQVHSEFRNCVLFSTLSHSGKITTMCIYMGKDFSCPPTTLCFVGLTVQNVFPVHTAGWWGGGGHSWTESRPGLTLSRVQASLECSWGAVGCFREEQQYGGREREKERRSCQSSSQWNPQGFVSRTK